MADARAFLRHTLATVAYRAGKVLRDVQPGFSAFAAAPDVRTPGAILAHLCDLLAWADGLTRGERIWPDTPIGEWSADVTQFFERVEQLDRSLAADRGLECREETLFQGPIADALTHVGQIAMLRRMAGQPIRAENYFVAEVVAGRVGAEQAAPRREFDS